MADGPWAEVAGPALAGLHADGGLQSSRGGVGRRAGRLGQVAAGVDDRLVRTDRGPQRVHHRLVALGRGTQLLDARQGGLQGGPELDRRHLGVLAQGLGGLPQPGAVQRARRPTGLADQSPPDGREHHPRCRRVRLVQHRQCRLEAAAQIDAVVGVADRGIEVGQVVGVVDHQLGGLGDPGPEHARVHHHPSRKQHRRVHRGGWVSAPNAAPGSRPERPRVRRAVG